MIGSDKENTKRITLELDKLIPKEFGSSTTNCMRGNTLQVADPGHVHHRWMADIAKTSATKTKSKRKQNKETTKKDKGRHSTSNGTFYGKTNKKSNERRAIVRRQWREFRQKVLANRATKVGAKIYKKTSTCKSKRDFLNKPKIKERIRRESKAWLNRNVHNIREEFKKERTTEINPNNIVWKKVKLKKNAERRENETNFKYTMGTSSLSKILNKVSRRTKLKTVALNIRNINEITKRQQLAKWLKDKKS